ncbi:collagenase-like [Schistocerca serialis cubense]|uniref:collagenase-like n=1 Tax=Schistocerca serialis cubense TaxID=2023355 RepID=UPI00214E95FD|nr:collagenase-like [Schistocerca serialis cubense]
MESDCEDLPFVMVGDDAFALSEYAKKPYAGWQEKGSQGPLVENSRSDYTDFAWGDSAADGAAVRTGRIVGGGAAARGQFPFAAYVNVAGTTACGAALITDGWLLTAGQCIYSYMEWTIYLGVIDLVTTDDYSVVIVTNSGLEHPGYDATTLRHNIGLLSVPGRVFFNQYVTPAALPRYSDVDSTFEGVDVMVTAWGAQATGGAAAQTMWYAYFQPVAICSPAWSYCGIGRYNEAICTGDFGSPMQRAESTGNYTLVGVASFIQGTTTCEGATSGFTMVAAYLDWINRHTQLEILP